MARKLKVKEPTGVWAWIKGKRNEFEAWVHGWFPGFKTRATSAAGAIAAGAAALQGYVTGLPTTKYITTEALATVSAILFTLSYWFSNMGKRVETAAD